MFRCLAFLLVLGLLLPGTLYAGDAKAPFEVEIVKNIAYNDSKDADAERHKLDLYLPKGAKDYPVFFFIHGGAWRAGNKNGFAAHGKLFASKGIAFVSTNYRLSPNVKHPAHIEDVAQAFAWCVKYLPKRSANVKQMYVSGHSAGGHLAALLGTDESYLKAHKLSFDNIKGVLPVSGVFTVGGERMADIFPLESGKKASPMTHVKDKMPPFLVFYADKELGALGKQAEAFGKAVAARKGDIDVKMIKDRDHGTIMKNIAKADDEVTTAMMAFIVKHGGLKAEK
jgi:dienelactone hydrolase